MIQQKKQVAATERKKSLYQDSDTRRIADVNEKEGDARSPFRRDFSRLIHSPCLRRLQGKSQLFPSDENDFFRNRLTHSLEVAQIATGLAIDLNSTIDFRKDCIDIDLVNFAAMAHDIGHPPFGHNGERALNTLMVDRGGFEGNAQTLRLLSKLEKKETLGFPSSSSQLNLFADRKDQRVGLNLTMRSLASILKYDHLIKADVQTLEKGYYIEEEGLVKAIKKNVCGDDKRHKFRTIECSIMDLADDIAYSTYDIEDALKGGFLSATAMVSISDEAKRDIIKRVNEKMQDAYDDIAAADLLSIGEFNDIILTVLGSVLAKPNIDFSLYTDEQRIAVEAAHVFSRSCELADNGYFRADFTSKLVSRMMRGVYVVVDNKNPALTQVKFRKDVFKMVEMLKRLAFHHVIDSHRLKIAEYRGKEIIDAIFNALTKEKEGIKLLPEDWRQLIADSDNKFRTTCDFIAGMTDRYCLEFYSRLVGINSPSIQKPY